MTLDEGREHIGAGVVYLSGDGAAEQGEITSVNDHYVFVRYQGRWQSQASLPGMLSFLLPMAVSDD